jgi:hypothetical protein
VAVTGLGRNFIARKAAEQLGFNDIRDLEEMTKRRIAKESTAVGVGLMAATEAEGREIQWTL